MAIWMGAIRDTELLIQPRGMYTPIQMFRKIEILLVKSIHFHFVALSNLAQSYRIIKESFFCFFSVKLIYFKLHKHSSLAVQLI